MTSSTITRWQELTLPLQQRWKALGDNERSALRLLGGFLAVLLAWMIAVQPAWRTLTQSPAQLEAVDAQLQDMQALAQETRTLRAEPPVSAGQALQALQAASDHLGSAARLSVTGDRAVLTLSGIDTNALQAWLGEVRSAARARPVEAQLQRGPKGFSGTITLSLNGAAP